ncbi:MAG: hypothetical protein ACOYIT_01955 [Christensenellales bacterium]
MKRKQLFSLIMAIAMLLSIMTIGLADSEEVVNPDGTKTVTTTHDDGSVTTEVFYGNGNINSRKIEYENGDIITDEFAEDGTQLSSTYQSLGDYKEVTTYKNGIRDNKVRIYQNGQKEITTYDDENGSSVTHDETGKLVGGAKKNEDGTREEWWIDNQGNRNDIIYGKDGNMLSIFTYADGYKRVVAYKNGIPTPDNIVTIYPDGYKKITTYDENGEYVTYDDTGKLVAEGKTLEDGTYVEWFINRDGERSESIFSDDGTEAIRTVTYSDGYKEIITFEKLSSKTHDADGNLIGEFKWHEDGTGEYWSIDREGVRNEDKYDERHNKIESTRISADGYKEITTYDENGDSVTKDENGNLLYTVTKPKEDYKVKKNADGKLLGEWHYTENDVTISSWEIDSKGNKIVFERDEEAKHNVTRIYSPAGDLIEETIRDLRDSLISKKTFEAKVQKQKYVWYPSNTTSTHGFAFREERPELTEKWYRFTPLDLSHDGITTIPLIGAGKYIIGSVTVEVSGDEVVVNYSYKGTPYDTARSESEYLNLLPNLADLETVEPEELGEGFAFGEPISIENDLDGDTNVLLFVRNTLTFCDFWRGDKQLARYWPNSKNYAEYYEYLRSIMD